MKKRTLTVGAEEVELEIIRSSRRTLALYVRPGGTLLIRAPWYVPAYVLMHFAHEKTDWIIRQREKLRDVKPHAEAPPLHYGSVIPWLGMDLTIAPADRTGNSAWHNGTELLVSVAGEPAPEKLTAVVEGWYLQEARKYFTTRTAELARTHAALLPAPKSVGVRKMKRRWGTCHANGAVWFNRELIKKDPVLVDYVIIHELCHLVHPNHGKEYYALLGSIIPDYHELKHKLQYCT